ncbi:MAG: peptide-methionine (S)-S-oxide reductase [Methanophagales archaeon]|nr:peptide-methionine (S)-S-oxide reductase [Methanophagales archaeon]
MHLSYIAHHTLLLRVYKIYRYFITHTAEQEAAARASKEQLQRSARYKRAIITEIRPASQFWRAEGYHQRYFEKQGLTRCNVEK